MLEAISVPKVCGHVEEKEFSENKKFQKTVRKVKNIKKLWNTDCQVSEMNSNCYADMYIKNQWENHVWNK